MKNSSSTTGAEGVTADQPTRIRGLGLRGKLVVYLVVVHLIFGAAAAWIVQENRWWLLLFEPLLLLSVFIGWSLIRALFVPLDLVRTGSELMAERDFSSTFLEVGQPELDALVQVYNRMVVRLREERLRLEEQNLFLDKLMTASPSGVVTLDHDGAVAFVNPAAARLPWSVAQSPERLLELPSGESQVLSLSGHRRVKVSRAEFQDRGFPRSFFVLEELTEELRTSEKSAYEKLIRMMSHEVNNTVGAVGSLLETFRMYAPQLASEDAADFTEALTAANNRLQNLRAFMSGFAEMVRLPPPDLRPCQLKQLVDEVLLVLRPQLEHRGIRCHWLEAEPVPPTRIDRNQIEQVLVNIVKNAMESIGQDGQLRLSLRPEADRVRLSIADTGPGIAEADREKLFTPFFSTKRDGRGLGLTLSHEILRQHGCEFGLENRLPGAEFWILFPQPSP